MENTDQYTQLDGPLDLASLKINSQPIILDEPFSVHLSFFSGPMDLLLHLVSQKEVPVEEVSMSEVLDQYLKIVTQQAGDLDLERASEYLVIVATLMLLKSKSLLPDESAGTDLESVDDEYSRFFEDLRARLIAFETTKLRAQALISHPQLDVDIFLRKDKDAVKPEPEEMGLGETSTRLGSLFLSLVKRVGGLGRRIVITIEPVSIVTYMVSIVDYFKNIKVKGAQSFFSLVEENIKEDSIRNSVLGSFVAILELAKRGVVKVTQPTEGDQHNFLVDYALTDVASSEVFESEFDEPTEVEDNKVISLEERRNRNVEEDVSIEEEIDNQEGIVSNG